MEKQPDNITVCNLECLLMPNGEVICQGNTIGWFREVKEFLHKQEDE